MPLPVLPRELQLRIWWHAKRALAAEKIQRAARGRIAFCSLVARALEADLERLATDPRARIGFTRVQTLPNTLEAQARVSEVGLFDMDDLVEAVPRGALYGRLWCDLDSAFIEIRKVCPTGHVVLSAHAYARSFRKADRESRAPRGKLRRPHRSSRLARVAARAFEVFGAHDPNPHMDLLP